MDWADIIKLIANLGLDAATDIIQKWKDKQAVTPDEVLAILNKGKQKAKDRMTAMLQAAGIDPASPQGQALLALT